VFRLGALLGIKNDTSIILPHPRLLLPLVQLAPLVAVFRGRFDQQNLVMKEKLMACPEQ
jgi:hypothetical protein